MKRALIAIALVAAEGACASSPSAGQADVSSVQDGAARCESSISWKDAGQHFGERISVHGPVVGTRYAEASKGEPTLLYVGRDYPDQTRFTVVIWGADRANFSGPPENLYDGATICVTGMIEIYRGVAETILRTEADILVEG